MWLWPDDDLLHRVHGDKLVRICSFFDTEIIESLKIISTYSSRLNVLLTTSQPPTGHLWNSRLNVESASPDTIQDLQDDDNRKHQTKRRLGVSQDFRTSDRHRPRLDNS